MEWQRLSGAIDVVRHDEATGVLEVRFSQRPQLPDLEAALRDSLRSAKPSERT